MPNLATQIHSQSLHDTIQALRYEAGLSKRVVAHLRGLEKDLVAELAKAGDIKTQRALKALLQEARAAIADRYEAAQGLFDDEMPQFASAQAGNWTDAMNGLVKVDIFRHSMTADQANAIASEALIEGAPSADWWEAQEADTLFKFKNAVRTGMLRGATGDEMAREVRDLMGTSMRNAQALVRTSVITVNNQAHLACYEANSDIIKGVQWVATLDPRTCPGCGALDGQSWKLGESHPVPSLHWGCRCAVIAQTKSWEELTGIKGLDDMPEGTRASMDGQVSDKLTYEDWLVSRTEEQRRAILGPARQRLLDQGKLTLRDLVDQRGNELTLAELRR